MKHPFSRLSLELEQHGIRSLLQQSWRDLLKEEFERVEPLLDSIEQLALYYHDLHTSNHYKIVYRSENDIFGINVENPQDRITLPKDEVLFHQFDLKRFCRIITDMLGFCEMNQEFELCDQTIPLGLLNFADEVYSVFLIIPQNETVLMDNIRQLRIGDLALSPKIILTPTRCHWTKEILDFMDSKDFAMTTLEEILSIESGEIWCTSETWFQTVSKFWRTRW
jgi:hypothetical protein